MKKEDFFRRMGFEIIKLDPGPHVNCDSCNEEYMNSDEKGGFLFGSKAICPKCAPKWEESAKKYNETQYIIERAWPDESFKDFVYRIREDYDELES
jgi:hypothetical protein